jgi:hypothetical protein
MFARNIGPAGSVRRSGFKAPTVRKRCFSEERDASAASPRKIVSVKTAAEVSALIPKRLAEHDGCERIVVKAGTAHLFSVDCNGERTPEASA